VYNATIVPALTIVMPRHRWMFVCKPRMEEVVCRELAATFLTYVGGVVPSADSIKFSGRPTRHAAYVFENDGFDLSHAMPFVRSVLSDSPNIDLELEYMRRRLVDPGLHQHQPGLKTFRMVDSGLVECYFQPRALPEPPHWLRWLDQSDVPHALQVLPGVSYAVLVSALIIDRRDRLRSLTCGHG